MAKFYIICHVIFCRDMTVCHDMRFISISHCMKKVIIDSIIGASLSKPHTSVTALLDVCVCFLSEPHTTVTALLDACVWCVAIYRKF